MPKNKRDQRWIYRFDQLKKVQKRCETWDDVKALLGARARTSPR